MSSIGDIERAHDELVVENKSLRAKLAVMESLRHARCRRPGITNDTLSHYTEKFIVEFHALAFPKIWRRRYLNT